MAKTMSSKYTEDWVPVKAINNGVILLDNKMAVTGVKIMPKNIFILDEQSQADTINGLENFYNQIDFEFWLICADRPVDITLYLSQLQLLYNETQSPAIRKLIMEDINKGNSFMNNNIVDTEYYILFKEKNAEMMQKKVRLLINGLSGCGLIASQTTNEDLRIILDNFLNGGVTTEFNTAVAL